MYNNIPVILMSTDYERLNKLDDCFADCKLEKPFDIYVLLEKVNTLVNKSGRKEFSFMA